MSSLQDFVHNRDATRSLTLRHRMDIVVAVVFVTTTVGLTVASAVFTRSEVLRGELAHGTALLDHLASMPTLRTTVEIETEIRHLQPYLWRVGSSLQLRQAETSRTSDVFIEKVLSQVAGRPTLQYAIGEPRVAQVTRSIVAMHAIFGLIALFGVLLAVEWTLRRRLAGPLTAIRRQVEVFGRNGWFVAVPGVDDELAQLQKALVGVGPAVTARTLDWIRRETAHESAAAAKCIHQLMEFRVPAVFERIENVTRSGKLSVLSLNEAYAAEEELLGIAAALAELQAIIGSPSPTTEGHA